MIVNVRAVCMGCNEKGVLSFGKPFGKLHSNLICFFRCDFSRLKGLADLVGNHIVFGMLAGDVLVLTFGKQKFLIDCHGVTLIPSDQLTLFGFLWILCIVCPIL